MLDVFNVTAPFFYLQASGSLANSIYLSVAKEVEGVVVSVSITATGFNTGTS